MSSAAPKKGPKPKGFRCPNCGGRMYAIASAPRASGVVVRRRRCPVCDIRVTTEERKRPQ